MTKEKTKKLNIKEVPRKIIRYLMFKKRDGNKGGYVFSKKIDSQILKYYEDKENFPGWDTFEIKWDVGFGDDIVAKINRKEKWFLCDSDKTEIIVRPEDYWEKEAIRRSVSTHTLLVQEAQNRNITIEEIFKIFFN